MNKDHILLVLDNLFRLRLADKVTMEQLISELRKKRSGKKNVLDLMNRIELGDSFHHLRRELRKAREALRLEIESDKEKKQAIEERERHEIFHKAKKKFHIEGCDICWKHECCEMCCQIEPNVCYTCGKEY